MLQLPPQPQRIAALAAYRAQQHGRKLARCFAASRSIVVPLFALCIAAPAFGQISLPKESAKSHPNDEAASILRRMAEAYARLPSLQQHSVYTSTLLSVKPEISQSTLAVNHVGAGKTATAPTPGSAPPSPGTALPIPDSKTLPVKPAVEDVADDSPTRRVDRTVDLLFVQPNLLKITDSRANATAPAQISKWVSDGKIYSSFVPKAHGTDQLLYTQEKAPRSIRGFTKLQNLDGGSLEMVMLMGINPFQNLTPDAATVLVEEPAIVHGVETEVVTMIAVTRTERDVLHLYIGKEDHLLHRFISEVSPTDNTAHTPRIGDALDDAADETRSDDQAAIGSDKDHPLEVGDTRTGGRTEARRTRVVYDNIMTPVTHVEHADFAFTPPTGAALFMPAGSKQALDPNSKRLADTIRKSIEGKTKPIHDTTDVHEISP